MTPVVEITGVAVAALGLFGGFTAFAVRYGNRLAFAERDSTEALAATKEHAVTTALNKDKAETALAKVDEHAKDLTTTKAQVAAMESVFQDIRTGLEKLDGVRTNVGEIATTVQVLASQLTDTRADVQDLSKAVTALKNSRRGVAKKRK